MSTEIDYSVSLQYVEGNIIGITDTSGNIIAKYTYDSWGELVSIKDSNDVDRTDDTTFIGYINPLRYRGYYYDSETGLYYLNARYYDPEVGRFINADETLDGGYNLLITLLIFMILTAKIQYVLGIV